MSRLSPSARELLAAEIAAAGGREVSFVATVSDAGVIVDARVVARGTIDTVLALAGEADRGGMLLHNHPGGLLEPSQADLHVAARDGPTSSHHVTSKGRQDAAPDRGRCPPRRLKSRRAPVSKVLCGAGDPACTRTSAGAA